MAEFIKPITSDHDLIALAERINVELDGIHDLPEIKKPLPKGSYLILLRKGDGVGHWVAQHDNEYFDSMGQGPPTTLGDLGYNPKQYQGIEKDYCGIFALLWLYSKQKNKPGLFDQFEDLDLDCI